MVLKDHQYPGCGYTPLATLLTLPNPPWDRGSNRVPHAACVGPGQCEDIEEMTDTHTEWLGLGGLCLPWWRALTAQPGNLVHLLWMAQRGRISKSQWEVYLQNQFQAGIIQKEATVDAFCTLALAKGQTLISTHTRIRGRLCHFSEPHPGKVLSFPWVWDIGVSGEAVPMSTIYIRSGLPPLPTLEYDNDILIQSLLSQEVAVTVNITKAVSCSSPRSLKEKRQQVFEVKIFFILWCHILSAPNTDSHQTAEDFISNNHPEQQFWKDPLCRQNGQHQTIICSLSY